MCRLCVLIATTDPSVSPSPGNPFRFSLSSWKIDPVCFPVANWSKCLTHVFPEPGKIGLKTILISHLIYLFVLLIEGWMSIHSYTLISMTLLLAHTVAQPIKWRFMPKNLNQLVISVIGLVFSWSWVDKNRTQFQKTSYRISANSFRPWIVSSLE